MASITTVINIITFVLFSYFVQSSFQVRLHWCLQTFSWAEILLISKIISPTVLVKIVLFSMLMSDILGFLVDNATVRIWTTHIKNKLKSMYSGDIQYM